MRINLIITAALLASSGIINAEESDAPKTMAECAKLTDNQKRLECFDTLSKQAEKAPEGFEIIELPRPSQTRPAKAKQENPYDDFGKEHVEASGDEKMVSSIEGEFKGWSGKTEFNLTNGQVWKQANSGTFYINETNPTIIIEKGFMGAYYLKVKGYNKRVAVKRLK